MATSSLTPSDLDAIRLILREDLENLGLLRDKHPARPGDEEQPGAVCSRCMGSGTFEPSGHEEIHRCPDCNGNGEIASRGESAAAEQPQRVALIIGKAYVSRDGEIWDCIGCTGEESRPMLCRERRSGLRQPFLTDGRWAYNRSNYDLVSRAPAEQPEWEAVLGSELREGDETNVPAATVKKNHAFGELGLYDSRGIMCDIVNANDHYTRRVRPKRPEWATQQSDATWLRSRIENPALLIQGGPYRTDGVAGELIRRLLPHVEAKARAMLAEVEGR